VLVAYSGGVDSSFLLAVLAEVTGKKALAVCAKSEVYPETELVRARKLAKKLGVEFKIIKTRQLSIPGFSDNPVNRCYYCKKDLFSRLKKTAAKRKIKHVLDGSNYSDKDDFRPGAKALKELGVRSPLKEAKLTKDDVRLLSKNMGLKTWDKPSFACLASRFPYNYRITSAKLKMVRLAEDFLFGKGFRQARVRHHGDVARIELLPADISRAASKSMRCEIAKKFKKLGYKYVTLDLQGFRSGSMNEVL
jgi:uncharacterized protein